MFAFICAFCVVIWILHLQSQLNNFSNRLDYIKQRLERMEEGDRISTPQREIETSPEPSVGNV